MMFMYVRNCVGMGLKSGEDGGWRMGGTDSSSNEVGDGVTEWCI